MRTHYDNLKVPETATRDTIKSSYRKLCLKHHPDRNPGNPDCERIMRIVNDAYAILSDPVKRRSYDQDLALRRARGPETRKDPFGTRSRHETRNRSQESRAHETTGGPYYRSRPDSGSPYQSPLWRHRTPPAGPGRGKMHFTMGMSMLIVIMIAANIYHKGAPSLPFSAMAHGQHPKVERATGASREANSKPQPPIPVSLFSDQRSAQQRPLSSPRRPGDYVRPTTAPNGAPWPMIANYVQGYPQEATTGESRVTLDNTEKGDDVFVKLIALSGGRAWQVRTCFLPASTAFTLMKLSPGDYQLRYQNMTTGETRATDIFRLQESQGSLGIHYTTLRLMLFKTELAGVGSQLIGEPEF